MIKSFSEKHEFLSNFFPCAISHEGIIFPTSEHAFQASKTLSVQERIKIAKLPTPGKAKRMGKRIQLRPDWESVKLAIMERILKIKFKQPEMKELLLATGSQQLIEGNTWDDTFWGVCKDKGQNHLGKILMKIRSELVKDRQK